MDTSILSELKPLIENAKSILIVTAKDPAIDSVAACLALSQALSQSGKITTVACPTPLTVEFSNLFGVDKVESKIGNKNLVISLDYSEGSIEKVSYNVENDKFNLIIQPKPGFPLFSQDKVAFTQSGVNADLLIVIGTADLSNLEPLFADDKEILEKIPLVNIDNHLGNRNFGKVNLVDQNAPSSSQLVMQLITGLNLSLDSDGASNILTGLESATNNFQEGNITAETFEAAALCLRYGARKLFTSVAGQSAPVVQPPTQTVEPPPAPTIEPVSTSEPVANDQTPTQKPPPDWLQPKIYKGGQLI